MRRAEARARKRGRQTTMTVSSIRLRWPRFFTVPRAILEECPTLSPAGKLIFVALCQLVDAEYECFPAHKYIGEVCSMSEKTVRRALAELRKAKLLTVEVRRDPKTGSRLSNLYTLEIPPDGSSRGGQIDQGAPTQIDQGAPPQNDQGLPPDLTRGPGQNSLLPRSSDLYSMNNNTGNGKGVVLMYAKMTGLKDLTEKQAEAWIQLHGWGYVQDKLKLLAAELETIEKPLLWLKAALGGDYQPAENLDQKRKDRRREKEEEKMQALRDSQAEAEKHRIQPGQATDMIQRLRGSPPRSGPGEEGAK